MKLQLVCLIFVLLSMTTQSLHAFRITTQVNKDLVSSETHNAEEGVAETTGLQALLQRSKRSMECRLCCFNGGCGVCCSF